MDRQGAAGRCPQGAHSDRVMEAEERTMPTRIGRQESCTDSPQSRRHSKESVQRQRRALPDDRGLIPREDEQVSVLRARLASMADGMGQRG